jgi:hypothetical protein
MKQKLLQLDRRSDSEDDFILGIVESRRKPLIPKPAPSLNDLIDLKPHDYCEDFEIMLSEESTCVVDEMTDEQTIEAFIRNNELNGLQLKFEISRRNMAKLQRFKE